MNTWSAQSSQFDSSETCAMSSTGHSIDTLEKNFHIFLTIGFIQIKVSSSDRPVLSSISEFLMSLILFDWF
jgi:hypothetical protein